MTPRITVLIPALNEEDALPRVLGDLPWELLTEVIVVDNGSTDRTAARARAAGARVVHEPKRGYGAACLAGIRAVDATDVVVFLDGDYSDDPAELPRVVAPLLEDRADLVIGSREAGARESGALLPHARFGNWLATGLIEAFYGVRYSDLGPFRAVRWEALLALGMADEDFGWTIEMQIRAVRAGLRIVEVPVRYRKRVGTSKISGNLWGSFRAGVKILYTIAAEALRPDPPLQEVTRERVSIILPVLDEAEGLRKLLPRLLCNTPPYEIIVVDGGSRDGSQEIARSFAGVRVIDCDRGRARQLNRGAEEASGALLWFLHADSLPPPHALREVRRVLADPRAAAGAFRFRLDAEPAGYRLVEQGVRMRSEWFQYPYGDQGLFIRTQTFHSVGGFPRIPVFEDLHLVRELRKRGKVVVAPVPLLTSARRWRARGPVATTVKNSTAFVLDQLGVPHRLTALLYPRAHVR